MELFGFAPVYCILSVLGNVEDGVVLFCTCLLYLICARGECRGMELRLLSVVSYLS